MTVSSRNWLAGTGRHAGRHQEDEALARWRREQRTDQVWRAVLPVLVFAGLAAAWQYASAYSGSVGGVLVPSFTQFAVAVGQVFTSGGFLGAPWASGSPLPPGVSAPAAA